MNESESHSLKSGFGDFVSALFLIVYDLAMLVFIARQWWQLSETEESVVLYTQAFLAMDAYSLFATPLLTWLLWWMYRTLKGDKVWFDKLGYMMMQIGGIAFIFVFFIMFVPFETGLIIYIWTIVMVPRIYSCWRDLKSEEMGFYIYCVWGIWAWRVLFISSLCIIALNHFGYGGDVESGLYWIITFSAFSFYGFLMYDRAAYHPWFSRWLSPICKPTPSDIEGMTEEEAAHYYGKGFGTQLIFALTLCAISLVMFIYNAWGQEEKGHFPFSHPFVDYQKSWEKPGEWIAIAAIVLLFVGGCITSHYAEKRAKLKVADSSDLEDKPD